MGVNGKMDIISQLQVSTIEAIVLIKNLKTHKKITQPFCDPLANEYSQIKLKNVTLNLKRERERERERENPKCLFIKPNI